MECIVEAATLNALQAIAESASSPHITAQVQTSFSFSKPQSHVFAIQNCELNIGLQSNAFIYTLRNNHFKQTALEKFFCSFDSFSDEAHSFIVQVFTTNIKVAEVA